MIPVGIQLARKNEPVENPDARLVGIVGTQYTRDAKDPSAHRQCFQVRRSRLARNIGREVQGHGIFARATARAESIGTQQVPKSYRRLEVLPPNRLPKLKCHSLGSLPLPPKRVGYIQAL